MNGVDLKENEFENEEFADDAGIPTLEGILQLVEYFIISILDLKLNKVLRYLKPRVCKC